jgi:oxygen-independent coproporphyrinogen-3 oxidase
MKLPISAELIERYNRPGPRYTSYPTVPMWSKEFGEADYRAALTAVADRPDDTLSLYVHLPFCAERCAYCGCNATSTGRPEIVDAYLDRVAHELDMVVPLLGGRRKVTQLHWGGGTPNFLVASQTQRLWEMLDNAFEIDRNGEIAIEIDPRIGSVAQLTLFRELGFNRISLGVQDIEPIVQQAIGRIQPFDLTSSLYHAGRELGFSSINLDLVYGLPYQTEASFAQTLDAIIGLRPDRIACFSYAHLPQARPNQKQVDAREMPTGFAKIQLFLQAIERFTEAGYDWLGMDHFALAGDELAVAARERRLHRNFMGYTTRPAPHQVAFGMSGIGDIAGNFVQNDAHLGRYQKAIDAGQLPIVRGMQLSSDDTLRRMTIMHLMCNLELPYDLSVADFGAPLTSLLGEELERIAAYASEGFVEQLPDRLRVTELGRFFIRNLGMELDAYLASSGNRTLFSTTV